MADNLNSMNPSLFPQQASQVWEMLDELAEEDPKAYESFIKQNLNQGSEIFSKPKSEVCIRAIFNTPPKKTASKYLYVNIFTWKQISEPKSTEAPVPMTCSDMKVLTIDKSECFLISVAINPKLYAECCENKSELNQLFELVLTYVKDVRNLDIQLEFSRLKSPCKGDPSISSTWLYEAIYRKTVPQEPPTNTENTPHRDLIEELSKLSVKESGPLKTQENSFGEKLIEEISVKEKPLFSSGIIKSDNQEVLKLCITLPQVKTVGELDLKISQDEVYLSNLYYELSTNLEREIDETSVKAKFDKSTHILIITANCLPTPI